MEAYLFTKAIKMWVGWFYQDYSSNLNDWCLFSSGKYVWFNKQQNLLGDVKQLQQITITSRKLKYKHTHNIIQCIIHQINLIIFLIIASTFITLSYKQIQNTQKIPLKNITFMTKRHSLSFNDLHPIHLQEIQQTPQIPNQNQNQNNYLALKKLKETEEKIEKMKRRLKVIQFKQHEGDHLVKEMMEKQRLNQMIKQEMQKSRRELQRKRIAEIKKIQQIKQRSINYRKRSQQKLLQAKQFILQKRSQIQKYIRTQSKQNQQSISKYRQLQLSQKKEKYKTIVQKEFQTKKKIDQYIQNKALSIKAKTSQQTLGLLKALKEKEIQLEELNKMQEKAFEQYRKKTAINASRLKMETQTSDLSRVNQQSNHSKRSSVRSRQKDHPQTQNRLIILQQNE